MAFLHRIVSIKLKVVFRVRIVWAYHNVIMMTWICFDQYDYIWFWNSIIDTDIAILFFFHDSLFFSSTCSKTKRVYPPNRDDITQEDCWKVINAFFQEKGLVRQQLDSFDEFIQNTMQEIVDETQTLVITHGTKHSGTENDAPVLKLISRNSIMFILVRFTCPNLQWLNPTVRPSPCFLRKLDSEI